MSYKEGDLTASPGVGSDENCCPRLMHPSFALKAIPRRRAVGVIIESTVRRTVAIEIDGRQAGLLFLEAVSQ